MFLITDLLCFIGRKKKQQRQQRKPRQTAPFHLYYTGKRL